MTLSSLLLMLTAAAQTAGPTLSADIRAEYLTGTPILVTIEARNETDSTVTMPDLAARHDLVRFELKTPSGQLQKRSTEVGDTAAEKSWQIPPRGAREVLLEVPSSDSLSPGDYEIAIHFELGALEQALPPQRVHLASPSPVRIDLTAGALPTERTGDLTPWLHKAEGGYDLYLHRASVDAPLSTAALDYLARLDSAITPSLTAARSTEYADRYIVWQSDERHLTVARLQGHRLRAAPREVALPWPRYSLAGRGTTNPEGRLHQPIWIPAPRGDSGELRLASVDEHGTTTYRRITRYDQRPDVLHTTVDDTGAAQFLIRSSGNLDLYTARTGRPLDEDEALPVPGRRLVQADPAAPIIDARFVQLPAAESFSGGLAVLIVTQTAAGTLLSRWVRLTGEPIAAAAPVVLPDGARLLDLSPAGVEPPGLLLLLPSGRARYQEGGMYQDLGKLSGEVALDRSRDGVPLLRQAGKPVAVTALQPDKPITPPLPK